MCVIILKDPGTTIPFEKLQSACIVNPDGWGFAVADRGKLTYVKGLNDKTDPEAIAKVLEDAKDQSLMLHLRYVTAGERSYENVHPWETLTKDKNGIDVAFCHNGTMYKWKKTGDKNSDSSRFNSLFLRPLFERVLAFSGPEKLFQDEFLVSLLEEEAGAGCFGFINGDGIHLAINHSSGKEYDGWWASNEYSFNAGHRTTSSSTMTKKDWTEFVWPEDDETDPWKDVAMEGGNICRIESRPKEDDLNKQKEEILSAEEQAWGNLLDQGKKVGDVVKNLETPRFNPQLVSMLLSQKAPTFVEITGIGDLVEVTRFDPEDLTELVTFYPEAAAVLLKDLLYELYVKRLQKNRAISTSVTTTTTATTGAANAA